MDCLKISVNTEFLEYGIIERTITFPTKWKYEITSIFFYSLGSCLSMILVGSSV